MIAMPDTVGAEAIRAADRIRQSMAGTPIFVDGKGIMVTTSCGVAQAKPNEQLREVFRRADSALYQAKRDGRNKVVLAADQADTKATSSDPAQTASAA